MILYSTVTQDELENAPEKVKELVKSLRADLTELIETTEESRNFGILQETQDTDDNQALCITAASQKWRFSG